MPRERSASHWAMPMMAPTIRPPIAAVTGPSSEPTDWMATYPPTGKARNVGSQRVMDMRSPWIDGVRCTLTDSVRCTHEEVKDHDTQPVRHRSPAPPPRLDHGRSHPR